MKRSIFAIMVGVAGALLLWIISPWNDFLVRASFLCDSYLPVGACTLLLVIVLGLNPLLRRFKPGLVLGHRDLLLVFGILYVVSYLPGSGLLRQLPYSVANVPREVSRDDLLAEAFKEARMRPELFPDVLEYGAEVPVSEYFLDKLPEGEKIPWRAWIIPAFAWGILVFCIWLMVIGMAQIVVPQWRDNERLAFPLIRILDPLLADPDPGRCLAGIFRSKLFWCGVILVLLIHLTNGYHERIAGSVPAIPLTWNISRAFTSGIMRHLPWSIKTARIYIMFLGVAFFMPLRISFSIWIFTFIYAAWRMIQSEYYPPYEPAAVTDHRMGAMIMMSILIVWLGRHHFGWVFSRLWVRATDAESRAARKSAIMFLAGCLGVCGWFWWARVPLPWSIALTVFGLIVVLVIARMVAETGMPFIRMQFGYDIAMFKMMPAAWFSVPLLFFIRVVSSLFTTASRMALSVLGTHALAADREADGPRRWKMGLLFIVLLTIGYFVCGTSHIAMNYHRSSSLDESYETPVNAWGTVRFTIASPDVKAFASSGRVLRPTHNQGRALLFGAGLAALLEAACLTMPAWPLHPIGLLMVDSYYANAAWPSIFIGWLCALLVLRYGGSRVYRVAAMFFIGVIVGDIIAGAYWSIESAIMAWLEIPYRVIWIQPS